MEKVKSKVLTELSGWHTIVYSDEIELYRGTDYGTVIKYKSGEYLHVKESFEEVDAFFDLLSPMK